MKVAKAEKVEKAEKAKDDGSKGKALETVIKEIESNYGKGSMIRLGAL